MRYNFDMMDSDSFELMVRSLNEEIFGIKCEQYGLGPDGQREFVFEGDITDTSGTVFKGRTIGQVKYKYPVTKEDDYTWLVKEIKSELNRFREQDKEYIPKNYLFYTNVVLTPTKATGVKDKIDKYVKEHNDIIPNFYIKGYDEICALLDNNRDVATSYACHILPGDVLMQLMQNAEYNYMEVLAKFLARELDEDMCTQMEQAGSVTEKKVSIEKVCVDIDVREQMGRETFKFASRVLELGNKVLGYRKQNLERTETVFELDRTENFVLIGGPGGGKTTICQFISQIYRANYLYTIKYRNTYVEAFMREIQESYSYHINCKRVPFKIVLKEYAAWISRQEKDANISIINYMRERIKKIEGDDLSLFVIRKMIAQLAWIFFFDGLDEVPESSNRQEVLKQINIFISLELKEANCDCMIIATTRMQGYNKDFDESRYEHLKVAELSKEDCIKYICKLFKVIEDRTEKREEYIEIMKGALSDSTTSRLMKTPLQVAIIAILVKSGGKPPHERYSLFRQYYDTVIKREKQKGVMPTLNDNTDWLEQIHLIVAEKLQRESENDENPSAEISQDDLNQIIIQYIEDNEDEFYGEKDASKKKDDFLKIIAERVCFLCENRDGFYSFAIRTLQEYFAGTYLVKNKSDIEAMENIRKISYKWYWRNTLLFALGYIELEKRHLENEIGALCGEMNGNDNLTKKDYTSENICLYGSWLAIDILAEDLFKGKPQNKYIRYAAEIIKLSGCKMFSNFTTISGVQCNKLLDYIKDRNEEVERKDRNNVLSLYIVLSKNEKNSMEADIDLLLQRSDEKDQIKFCIQMLSGDRNFSKTAKEKWRNILIRSIKSGKVKQQLPVNVLKELAYDDIYMKRFLFEQCLNNWKIEEAFIKEAFKSINIKALHFFIPRKYEICKQKIEIAEGVRYYLSVFWKEEFEEFRELARELHLEYIVKMCNFLMNPTFAKYKELAFITNEDERNVVKKYLGNFHLKYEKMSEEMFDKYMNDWRINLDLFEQNNVEELMQKNQCEGLEYSVTCCDNVFDNLIEKGIYREKILNLGDKFLESYVFVASVQIEHTKENKVINEITIDRLVELVKEVNQRKIYGYQIFAILIFILNSKYYIKLQKSIPDLEFIENMGEVKILREIFYWREWDSIVIQSERVISNIVRIVIDSEGESNYLMLLLCVFIQERKFYAHISSEEILELKQIDCRNEYNKLAIYLLELCNSKSENPQNLLECITGLKISKELLYTVLANVLRNGEVDNRDRVWTLSYLLLEQENFERKEEILSTMIDNMLEIKGNS